VKDFAEFRAYCKTLDNQKIQDDIITELNEYAKANNIPDEYFAIWFDRSFSHKLMMKFLEEYHNWLHSEG